MSSKLERQFLKLRKTHAEAISAREAAARATRDVLDGKAELHKALSSKAGGKALAAEIAALKEERRALKRLAAFVERHPAPAIRRAEAKVPAPAKLANGKAATAKKGGRKTAADGSRTTAST